jgi:hypothetical protein
MGGILDVEKYEAARKEIEVQRKALREARDNLMERLPELPRVSNGSTSIRILKNGNGDADSPSRIHNVLVRHKESNLCGGYEHKELYYWPNDLHELRDCLCKLIGVPTKEELDAVVVE